MSCLLVNLACTRGAAEQLALLAASMRGVRVRCERFAGADPAKALAVAMGRCEDDFADAIVLLGDEPRAMDSTQAMLDALHARGRGATGLVVGVTTFPGVWASLRGVDGFVCAEEGRAPEVAAQLFIMLASLMAPELWACLDADDLRQSLGTAACPSKVVEAVWFEARQQLVFVSEADEQTFRRSASAAVFIYANRGMPLARVWQALRSRTMDGQSLAFAISAEFLVESTSMTGSTQVKFLCAGTAQGKPHSGAI